MPGRQGNKRGGGGRGGRRGNSHSQSLPRSLNEKYGDEIEQRDEWTQVPQRRKNFIPAKPRHNLPPIEIQQPKGKGGGFKGDKFQSKPRPPASQSPTEPDSSWKTTEDEYNAHLSERFGNRKPKVDPPEERRESGAVPKNLLVEKYERESTKDLPGWRGKSEIPGATELFGEEVVLPVNVVNGPWDNVEEYLESHFELLREDAFAPLRDAVGLMRAEPMIDDREDLCVYENVKMLGLTFARTGVCVKMSFSLNRARKRIKWKQSKRLNPGTLVALSSDSFQQDIKIATVAARPLTGLENNPPEVDILFDAAEIDIDPTKTWVMVEARSSYFEAYRHTLKALQRMKEETFPLANHLAKLDKNIGAPAYLLKSPVLDLNPAFPDHPDKEALSEVDVLDEWPTQSITTSMDKTQIEALNRIITKKLAIVQGPPGTGKTFTSVLALHTMLNNKKEGDPPIIVACQTNHALDQLLRHVLEFEPDIVRVGSRTQDKEKIAKKTLFEKRQGSSVAIKGAGFIRAKREMEKLQTQMCTLLETINQDFLDPKALCEYGIIKSYQQTSFENASNEWVKIADDDKPNTPTAAWLGNYVVPVRLQEDMYHEYEDEDIDMEELQEREAEFAGNDQDNFDEGLRGGWYDMKRSFTVDEPMGVTEEDVREHLNTRNVQDIPEHIRPKMYLALEKAVFRMFHEKFRDLNKRYQEWCKNLAIARMEKDAYILSRAELIGLTTTGLSKYRSLIAAIEPKVILIEEAAESLEGPLIVGCYPSIEHLILVGDHKQLRGHCSVYELEAEPYNLGISMFERLVNNGMEFTVLSRQRRMRPEIREILNPIYSNLQDDAQVLNRPNITGMGKQNVFFYAHTIEEGNDELSKCNWHEAEMVVSFCDYLIFNGASPKSITILTFYSGQLRLINRKLRKNAHLHGEQIRVATVDSYQGEENDIVILSLVRSNSDGKIGFLGVENRVCVSLSRAQRGFYLFGNIQMLSMADKLWWDVASILNRPPPRIGMGLPLTCTRHKRVTTIQDLSDWIGINGGCNEPCKELLPCKHTCHLKCHPFDHEEVQCNEKCSKVLPCDHPCQLLCSQTCMCKLCDGKIEREQNEFSTYTRDHYSDIRNDNTDEDCTINATIVKAKSQLPMTSSKGTRMNLSSVESKQVLGQMAVDAEATRAKSGTIIDVEEWAAGGSPSASYDTKKYASMHPDMLSGNVLDSDVSHPGSQLFKTLKPTHVAKKSVPPKREETTAEPGAWETSQPGSTAEDDWGGKVSSTQIDYGVWD